MKCTGRANAFPPVEFVEEDPPREVKYLQDDCTHRGRKMGTKCGAVIPLFFFFFFLILFLLFCFFFNFFIFLPISLLHNVICYQSSLGR